MSPAGPTVRVLVVEDSAVQRAHLVQLLSAAPDIQVVGQAAEVGEAIRLAQELRPALVTMDLELPGGTSGDLGGLEAIRAIMRAHPIPILVLSLHAPSREATPALDALDAGAIDVLPKPGAADAVAAETLRRRVRLLSRVPMVRRRVVPPPPAAGGAPAPPLGPPVGTVREGTLPVIALAASTGGPGALRTVIAQLRRVAAPILVVQHIHPEFVASFASWLQETTLMPVAIPVDGETARPGTVYVAPADTHLRLTHQRVIGLDPEPELLSRPSADELLKSVAAHAGSYAIGAVLSGMGDDGAEGLLCIRRAGGRTFAQDGESSTVDGMPRASRELGGAEHVLPVDRLGAALAQAAESLV